jgi:hypothetical protein
MKRNQEFDFFSGYFWECFTGQVELQDREKLERIVFATFLSWPKHWVVKSKRFFHASFLKSLSIFQYAQFVVDKTRIRIQLNPPQTVENKNIPLSEHGSEPLTNKLI